MYRTEIESFNKESHEEMREVRGIQTYRSRAILLSALKYGSMEVDVGNIILNSVRQHNFFITHGNYMGYMFRL